MFIFGQSMFDSVALIKIMRLAKRSCPLNFALQSDILFIIEYYRTFKQLPSTANAYCNGRSYDGVLFSVMEENQLDWRNHVIFY